ncbi:PEGA domain-containing protein [Sphingosinicella sp. CPCC 101087]|uniref:PEGA domain-containing protein n=1 Tax=Sphingosinicella sp. CPCC 101087 TaxID=2497754 RepID=UPI00101CFFC4|nr:PEGA domain-containing protein [Sphingosinicella sp. CPCC 101087]
MKKYILACAMIPIASGLGGCATVMNGTSQPVEFQSDPSGATITLVNGLTCETPCQYSMKRGDDSMVTFTLAGYEPVEVYIQSRTGGGVVGNVLAGGIIGGVVDASNGASNHLYPDPVYIRLVQAGSTAPAVMLNKRGEVIGTVDEYNARVASDVIEGMQEQGLFPAGRTAG